MYEWVFIITDIFGAYIIYKFMKVFFETRRSQAKIELLTYIGYYIFIAVIYIVINIPIVLMISNLLAFIGLTFNYESTIKKRVLSALLIYLILLCVEMIVALMSGYFNFPIFSTNNYTSIYGLIVCKILSFVVVLILNNYKNIKRGEIVPSSNWFNIILIPATSLYIILLLFLAEGLSANYVIVGVLLMLLINFATFNLYDAITAALSERMESRLLLEQNKYYDRQLETMRASLENTKAIRHDLKNHMFSISSLVQNSDKERTLQYISQIMKDFGADQNYASSGNMIIDSIVNFKFQEAERRGINTTLDLNIPENLEIPPIDMTIVLGNLLDNAIEAATKVEENPYINVKIKYDKGRVLLQIDNPYTGEVKEENGRYITVKEDKSNHGIGLKNVDKIVPRYNGTMSVDHSGNVFSVTVLMYVD
ncbi:MAG: GHKL domain-containing protein [Clostridia bacterium]|nr:GHKL domain-containing protein [Clostridia bacterium]